jgi:preprotein translocase subunit SecE
LSGAAETHETIAMAKTSLGQFIQQVRQETAKVTWPTRKETATTTVMVFIMVLCAALFFFTIDQILSAGVRFVLGLGS